MSQLEKFSGERATNSHEILERPIPLDLPSVSGYKEIPIQENGEPLVPLGPFSEHGDIFTNSIYFGERKDSPYDQGQLDGALITTFARKDVANQLREAQKLLPKNMFLVVYDAYRSLEVQGSLHKTFITSLRTQNPSWTEQELEKETAKFVSAPSRDIARPATHNTGGSVDLVIVSLPQESGEKLEELNRQIIAAEEDWEQLYKLEMQKIAIMRNEGHMLNFGTAFDYAGEKSGLNYYERLAEQKELSDEEKQIQSNRRLLYNIMMQAGFEPYQDEWWHFNSKKTQMGAKTAGINNAEYGPVVLSEENKTHEKMRSDHWLGSIKIREGWERNSGKVDGLRREFEIAQKAVIATGDPRDTTLPKAEIIEPGK